MLLYAFDWLSHDPVEVDRALESGRTLFVAVGTIPGKVTGPSPEAVDRLFTDTSADYVIVEADGARSMSVKAPAEHEPVIPSRSTLVVIVVGIDAVGNVDVDLNFVATQRVVSFCFRSRWSKFTAVARGPVVVENDLAIEVF